MSDDAEVEVSEVVMCARYGEFEDLVQLADAGESLTAVDASGNTALHMASANGHSDIVTFLIGRLPAGALDTQNQRGNTALHWAALNGHLAVVQALLAAGALPQVKNANGRTPLDEALQNSHEAVCEAIARSPKYKEEDGEENDPPRGPEADDEADEDDDEQGDQAAASAAGK